jgi:hypothetical protein
MFGLTKFEMGDRMRIAAGAAFLAAMTLMGCTGPQGNPNRLPYANEPGGAMAAKPAPLGTVAYDPYANPAPFADMQAAEPAINPAQPLPLPMPAANPPMRNR